MKNLFLMFLTFFILTIGCKKDPPSDKTDFPFENSNIRMEVVSGSPKISSYIKDMQFIEENTGFIISYEGKIYKTIDKGNTWILKFTNPTPDQPFYKILFTDKNTGYVVSGNSGCHGTGCKPPGGLVLKTLDAGETWTKIYEVKGSVEFIGIAKNNIGDLFIIQRGYYNGKVISKILKSSDGGSNWETTVSLNLELLKITFSDGRGFCSTGNGFGNAGIVRSNDNGNTWKDTTNLSGFWTRDIAFKGEIGYCITDNSLVYQTTNNGEKWNQIHPSTVYTSAILNPLTENSCLIWGSGNYPRVYYGWETEYHGYNGGVRQTTNSGKDWIDHEIKDLEGIKFTSFYTSTEGYILSDKLIKVTVK